MRSLYKTLLCGLLDLELYATDIYIYFVFRGFQRAMVKSMAIAAKVPHFHYVEEINCDSLVELKASFQGNTTKPDVKHTFLPLLIKSLSMAMSKYPLLNSCFNEEAFEVTLKGML